MKLVIVDNYDSFTYNLYQLFAFLGVEVEIFRNDAISVEELLKIKPHRICISPGPKAPKDSGISMDVVRAFHGKVPILGVCLGMQVINEVFGGRTDLAPYPVHGKKDLVYHNGKGILKGIPSPFYAARYHSLQCRPVSPELEVVGKTKDGVVMAVAHRIYPTFGVQFHPESFLSEYGREMAENFIYGRF